MTITSPALALISTTGWRPDSNFFRHHAGERRRTSSRACLVGIVTGNGRRPGESPAASNQCVPSGRPSSRTTPWRLGDATHASGDDVGYPTIACTTLLNTTGEP